MSLIRHIFLVIGVVLAGVSGLAAQERGLSALALADPQRSDLRDEGRDIVLELGLSQAVPFRVTLLESPPRLVLDFREVDFGTVRGEDIDRSDRVSALRMGRFRPGWSRLVAELDGPYRVVTAAVSSTDPRVTVRLTPTDADRFAALVGGAPDGRWDLPMPAKVDPARTRQTGAGPLVVVLDPGHGGLDPGAEAAGLTEADLMLVFARELKELMLRAGLQVVMTREEDVFVPLETRITIARAARADVFLSLHADALDEGEAVGATIYRLSEKASDAASRQLAERHDRADLLAGLDLSAQDDQVADLLMDLARTETQPRADRLADTLVAAIRDAGGQMHKHPIQSGQFSVLKAPDIPSLLVELGFMSSSADLLRLQDAEWRATMQAALLAALRDWAVADAAEARLLRQ